MLAVGQLEDSRNLVGIGRVYHRIRQEFHLGGVIAVADHVLFTGGDIFLADYSRQLIDQTRVQHVRNLSSIRM